MIQVGLDYLKGYPDGGGLLSREAEIRERLSASGMNGWLKLPEAWDGVSSRRLRDAAARIAGESEVLLVLGIGGSYLGARAMIEALRPGKDGAPEVIFAGNNLSGAYLERVLEKIGARDFSVNVVSKSGSTLETAVAFRVFSALLVKKYGGGASARVVVTTGAAPSRLRRFAQEKACALFDIPDDVGGRYSALTAAGLLPAAAAGCDADAIMEGARDELESGGASAFRYAAARQALYRAGYSTEALACFEPAMRRFGEWWKQLFGESEGKNGQGVFPATLDYTADLHAMGQYMQEGARDVFETVLSATARRGAARVPEPALFDDGLTGVTGRSVDALNVLAEAAVKKAHSDGGVPVLSISAPDGSARAVGALIAFFERACALSALLSGVNPFDQPGVEAYKKNLFSMLNGAP